jgi:hypothetical protein
MRPIQLVAAAALLLAIMAIPATRVAACSCVMSTAAESARLADAVFTGTVVGMAEAPMPARGDLFTAGGTIYTFAVDGVAKGAVGPSAAIMAGGDEASCGIGFEADARYLVFAYAAGGGLETNLCAGNIPLADGEEAPIPMAPVASEVEPAEPEVPWVTIGVLGAIALIVGLSALAFARSR